MFRVVYLFSHKKSEKHIFQRGKGRLRIREVWAINMMNPWKKSPVLLLAAVLSLGLTACDDAFYDDDAIGGQDWRTTGVARDGGIITCNGEETYVHVCIHKTDASFYYDTIDQTLYDFVEYPIIFGDDVWDLFMGTDFTDLNGDGNSDVTMKFLEDGSEIVFVWYWDAESGTFAYQPDQSSIGDRKSPNEIYHELLEQYYTLVSAPDGDMGTIGDGTYGVRETAWGLGADAMNGIGYLIKDMSDDGVPELAVGSLREYGGEVYALYTLDGSEPKLVFEGWSRNSIVYVNSYVGGSSVFYSSGSRSASESCQGVFTLSRDGQEQNWRWFYFTCEKDGNPDDVTLYANKTGSWDPEESEVAYETPDEFYDLFALPVEERVLSSFWAINNCTESGLDLTPFSDWESESSADS